MIFTGLITAALTFAVYVFMLRTADADVARSYAFTVLVFAEMLRAFGARSDTRPLWRISLLTNRNLLLVVAASLAMQFWSHHSTTLGGFLRTTPVPFTDGLLLLALGTIPLLVLEAVKLIRKQQA